MSQGDDASDAAQRGPNETAPAKAEAAARTFISPDLYAFSACLRSRCFLYRKMAKSPAAPSNMEETENRLYTKMVDGFPASNASRCAKVKPTMPSAKLGKNPTRVDRISTSSARRS